MGKCGKVYRQMIEDIKYNPESNKFMTDLLAYSKIYIGPITFLFKI